MTDSHRRWLRGLHPPWPVSWVLFLFVIALMTPLLFLSVLEGYQIVGKERAKLHAQTNEIAHRVVADLDQTLAGYLTILETLANSPALAEGDFASLYDQAKVALAPKGLHAFLRDGEGRQILNTRVPFGEPLPTSRKFDAPLFTTLSPYLSDVVIGRVSKRPAIGVSVPVLSDGKLQYVVSLSLELAHFESLLERQKLPEIWSAAILDRKGSVIARSSPPSEEASRNAIGVQLPSRLSGWTVSVEVPEELAVSASKQALYAYVIVVSILTVVGGIGAFFLARLIVSPLRKAAEAAKNLGLRRTVSFTPSILKEANAVSRALVDAAEQRERAETEMRRATERFMASEEAAGGALYEWDIAADRVWRSVSLTRMLGWQPDEIPPNGAGWRALLHPDDRERLNGSPLPDIIGPDGHYGIEVRIRHRNGHYVWVWDRGRAFRDEQGRVVRLVGAVIDITQRKALEQQQQLLLRELTHRSKNLLTVVQAIASRTLSISGSTEEARRALSSRLQALARTYDIIQNPSAGAPIAQIIKDQLRAFGTRATIAGPDVMLNARVAQTLALIIHELATNASKYGALSVPEGTVLVHWGVEGETFRFVWVESGGPADTEPDARRGFGTLLTVDIARSQIDAKVVREFRDEGLFYQIEAPLASIVAGEEDCEARAEEARAEPLSPHHGRERGRAHLA